jgi:transcriptional regulator with PAS, ATPase and Fis domain
MVEDRTFREDLYYRLSVIPLVVPPLRERTEDIPLLVENFIRRIGSEKKCKVLGVDREAMGALCNYQWPGNIRELENLIERLVIIKGSGSIMLEDLPDKYVGKVARKAPEQIHFPSGGVCFNTAMEEFENRLISEALQKSDGNKKEAAQLLNLKRTTLIEKLKKKKLFPELSMSVS